MRDLTWSHVTNKKHISTSTSPMIAKLDNVEVYSKGQPSIEYFDILITWSGYHVTDGKRYILTSARPMVTKLDRVVGSNEDLLSIKSLSLLITCSHMVTWQMKNVLNSLSRDLSLSNLTEGWLMIRSHMSNHKATYSFDHVVTWAHATNELCYIFTSTRPIATKLNRMIAYNEEPPLIK